MRESRRPPSLYEIGVAHAAPIFLLYGSHLHAVKSKFFLKYLQISKTLSIFAVSIDGIRYTLNTSNHTATVTGWDSDYGYLGDVIIPEEIIDNEEKYRVTSIGSWAFLSCKYLTSITIPNSVISINSTAFQSCDAIQRFEFHCRDIGSWFTWQKTSLKEIILGKEVASIAQDAFKYCKTITTIKEVDGDNYESINGSFVFPS